MRVPCNRRAINATWLVLLLFPFCAVGCAEAPREPGGSEAVSADRAVREYASILGVERRASDLATGRAAAWALDADDGSELAAAGAVAVDAPLEAVPRLWGLSALDDQTTAGIIMWAPGSVALLVPAACLALGAFEGTRG